MICDGDKSIISNACETVSTAVSSLTSISAESDANIQNIRVVARIRPLSTKEIDEKCKESLTAAETLCTINVDKTKKFEYDAVFGPGATQSSVYEKTAGDMIRNNLFKGFNVTVLAYGQTGSGKTHTVFGSNTITHEGPLKDIDGIIPRAIYDVFNFVGEMDNGAERVTVEMSYLEIYNEEAKDLLTDDPKPADLIIRENKTEGVVVQNLSRHIVNSRKQIADLMESAWGRRATAATAMNEVSSRSHAICTIYIKVSPPLTSDGKESICEDEINAKLTLVDLAGSERVKKTGAEGARLKEGININKGLFVLGQVVSALAEIEQQSGSSDNSSIHVKYRDSKLTRLLQDSLGGNSKTVMVACISPSDSNMEESINTLRYAERTRNIRTSAVRNVVAATMSASEAAALRKENQMLKLQLFQAQTKLSSRVAAPVSIVFSDSQNSSLSHPEDCMNETNGLDLKKLDMITKLRLYCSAMKEKTDQLEDKVQSSIQDSLQAALRADKWQVKCEDLMTSMKSHGIPYPDSLKNEGRFQSLHIMNEMRRELNEQKSELRDAKIDAEVSRATAAALLNGNGDESIVEKMTFADDLNSMKCETEDAAMKASDEKLTAELIAVSESIDQKEVMFRKVSQEKDCMEAMRSHFESAIKSLQHEVEALASERDQILVKVQKNSSPKSDTKTTKMRQRITQLEARIKELRLTHAEHNRSLKLRESASRRSEKLEAEIKADKKIRCGLQRKLREQSDSRRCEKKAAKLHASRLLRDAQRLKYELNKVKESASRQAVVLKRKAADAISKQKLLAKKRSHTTMTNSQLTGVRKEELTNWLDREIASALCLKELREQIESHQSILDDAETRKQQLVCQSGSHETNSALQQNLCVEIEMRSGIIDQLEKNANEILQEANKNSRVKKNSTCVLLESTFWQSLSRSEIRFIFNEFFISLVDEKYQYTSQKESHDTLLGSEVRKAVEERNRLHEKEIADLNIRHSSTITDLLESTKATIEADIGGKLNIKSSQDENTNEFSKKLMDQILNRYMQSCTKISDSVRTDLNNIKATQDSMRTIMDDVVVGIISHNEANAAVMSEKKKKKKNVLQDTSYFSEIENDDNESIIEEDSDDSDWSPGDTPAQPSKKKRLMENESAGTENGESTLSDEENYKKMTCIDLRKLLRERNLLVSGRKAELIARLKDNTKLEILPDDPADGISTINKEKMTENDVEGVKSTLKMGKRRILSTKEDNIVSRSKKKLRSSDDSYDSASSIECKRRIKLTKGDNNISRWKKKLQSSVDNYDTASSIDSKRHIVSTKEESIVNQSNKKMRSSGDTYDSTSSIDSIEQKSLTGRIRRRRIAQVSKSNSVSPSNSMSSKVSVKSKRKAVQLSSGKAKRPTRKVVPKSTKTVQNVSRNKVKRSPLRLVVNNKKELSRGENDKNKIDTKLALVSDVDKHLSCNLSSRPTTKKISVTSLPASNENSGSCPTLRRSSRMKENCHSIPEQKIGSAQVCSTITDPLATITNSAQKRKRIRRQSMASSVSRAMMQLEALEETL